MYTPEQIAQLKSYYEKPQIPTGCNLGRSPRVKIENGEIACVDFYHLLRLVDDGFGQQIPIANTEPCPLDPEKDGCYSCNYSGCDHQTPEAKKLSQG